MNATASNGRPQRKQLSDQLDRLDGIIDTLAEGLNSAVADAAREGSRQAVKEIVTELLTNPDILSMIRTAALGSFPLPMRANDSDTPASSPIPARPAGRIASAVSAVATTASSAVCRLTTTIRNLWTSVVNTVSAVRHNPQLQKMLVLGTTVGLATAVLATTNHTIAAALSGFGAAATVVSVQVHGWLRGIRHRLGVI
jgi:hypothetical protein